MVRYSMPLVRKGVLQHLAGGITYMHVVCMGKTLLESALQKKIFYVEICKLKVYL